MKRLPLFILLIALVALPAAGCGGGDDSEDVPDSSIALVGGREIPKKDFDALIAQAKRSYQAQKRDFPKVGTAQYTTLKNQAVQFLVQRAQFELKADDLDIDVTDAEVTKRLGEIKKQYFGGSEKRYKEQLKQQGLTEAQVKKDIRAQLIQEELFEKVTADVKITDKEIEDYYKKNKAQYGQPESREIRHILVSSKKQADQLYTQLKNGADFAALAKKYSEDASNSAKGGDLDFFPRGRMVPEFDAVAFELAPGQISDVVKTQFGYHIIKVVEKQAGRTVTLEEAKPELERRLRDENRSRATQGFLESLRQRGKIEVFI